MSDRLTVDVGGVQLINPLVCGAGEHLIDPQGVRAAIAKGAGAVIVKSANESEPARRLLAHSDYALFDASWRRLEWDFNPPADATLFNRSGLHPDDLEKWVDTTAALVADQGPSMVVPSIIPADYTVALALAADVVEATRCDVIEVNIGAPHAGQARPGSIALETDAEVVRQLVKAMSLEVSVPLWIKLTGQSDGVTELAVAAFEGGAYAVTIMGRFMAFVPDVETQSPALGTMGAIGGSFALPLTCRWLAMTRATVGPDKALIATNGARTGLDIARFMLAGATAVQMTSAIFTGGFDVISQAVVQLDAYLNQRGDTASGLIGRAADRLTSYTDQPYQRDHWRSFIPDPNV